MTRILALRSDFEEQDAAAEADEARAAKGLSDEWVLTLAANARLMLPSMMRRLERLEAERAGTGGEDPAALEREIADWRRKLDAARGHIARGEATERGGE